MTQTQSHDPTARKTSTQDLRNPTTIMERPTFLSLPTEIRLQVYSYLTPPALTKYLLATACNLRLVCHQIKSEYEHIAKNAIFAHFKKNNPPGRRRNPGYELEFLRFIRICSTLSEVRSKLHM